MRRSTGLRRLARLHHNSFCLGFKNAAINHGIQGVESLFLAHWIFQDYNSIGINGVCRRAD
jgi:hypothetical protein